MASLPIFAVITLVSAHGFSLEGLPLHRQCESDHQCDYGFFCYEASHLCTRCVDCGSYQRKSSWRSCPQTPADCGGCRDAYGEEILHNGRTRDMCIPSSPNNLSHTIVSEYSSMKRIAWAAGISALLLPVLYYVFSRKNHMRDRSTVHHDGHREEPPPYRSMELFHLSTNHSEEQLTVEHVMNIGQQKDHLVQAVPFQKPAYMEEEFLEFDNSQNENSDNSDYVPNEFQLPTVLSVDLQDENTMPSDWTPDEGSLPAAKRYKAETETQQQHNCGDLSINLFISNNVTVHKPH